MNLTKFYIFLFIIFSIGSILSVLFEFKTFEFIIKPLIIPSIFIYYLRINKGEINSVLVLLLILNFASDMIAMLNFEKRQLFIIGLNLVIDIVLLYCFLVDYLKFNKLHTNKIMQSFLILLGFILITIVVLNLIPDLSVGTTIFYVFLWDCVVNYVYNCTSK